MIENYLNKTSPLTLGFLQALGVGLYVGKVAAFMFFLEKNIGEPGYFGVALILTLFVFSAGLTGTLVFGTPAYFALKGNISKAVSTLLATFVSLAILITVTALTIYLVF
ncbi:MAG: hypothetical protein Q8P13_03195 [bacterium]|nr:hypothetical protein [bacterium]